jgi:hypothetical protein
MENSIDSDVINARPTCMIRVMVGLYSRLTLDYGLASSEMEREIILIFIREDAVH